MSKDYCGGCQEPHYNDDMDNLYLCYACMAVLYQGKAEIERLSAENRKLQAVYELVSTRSHACSGRDCIGYRLPWDSATQNRCNYCSDMRKAMEIGKERSTPMTDSYDPDDPYDPEGYRHEFDAATDAQKEAVIMAALRLNHALGDGWHYGPSATEAFKELCDALIIVLGERKRDEPEAPTTHEEGQ